MTLSLNQWEKEYLADGVSVGPYGIPFPFQSTADLRFFGITAAGVATLRTPQTVVKFDNAVGGTFTLAGSPVVSGGRVRVERVPPATQSLDLIAKGSFQPDLIEQELDRVQMQIQELRGRLTRLVGLPDLLALRGANLPAPQGNYILSWNSDGTGFANLNPALVGATGPRGATGPTGPQGPQGIQGVAGRDGTAISLKGSKATIGALPASGNTVGDAWIVSPNLHIWNGTSFDNVGQFVGPAGPAGADGAAGPAGPPGADGAGGGGGGTSDHGLLTGLTDDDHTQYHNDARALTWSTDLSAEAPTNQTEIDAATAAGTLVPEAAYRRPWSVRGHVHDISAVTGLASALDDTVKKLDGNAAYLALTNPLLKHGTATVVSGVLTLDVSTGHYFHMRIRENITSVVITRGTRPDPAIGFTEEFALFVQQPATGTATYTIDWPDATFKFPGGTVIQPSTGNDIATVFKWRKSTASTVNYLEVVQGYDSPDEADTGSGVFMGTHLTCDRIGNLICQSQYVSSTSTLTWLPAATLRLPAGTITHVRMNTRLNEPKYADGASGGPGYGNGDCIGWYEVRDIKADGTPDMSGAALLGRTADFTPSAFPNQYKKFAFNSSFALATSKVVAIVCRISSVSTSALTNNDYAWSMNYTIRSKPLTPTGGPAFGAEMRVYRSSNNGSTWEYAKGSSTISEASRGRYAFFGEFYYNDGSIYGNQNVFANIRNSHVKEVAGASNKVRQKWKMGTAPFTAKGFWLCGYSRSTTPTLQAVLSTLAGTLIEMVTVDPTKITKFTTTSDDATILNGSNNGASFATDIAAAVQYFYTPLASSRTFAANTSYQLVLEAGERYAWSGSAWVLNGAATVYKGHVAAIANLPGSGNTTGDAYVVGGDAAALRFWGVINATRRGDHEGKQVFPGAIGDTNGQFTTNGGTTWTDMTTENGATNCIDTSLLFEG